MPDEPRQFRHKPTTITCFVWTGPEVTLPIQQWIAGLMGISVKHVANEIFTHSTLGYPLAKLYVARSATYCTIHHGDAVAHEPDRLGFYPITSSNLAANHTAVNRAR